MAGPIKQTTEKLTRQYTQLPAYLARTCQENPKLVTRFFPPGRTSVLPHNSMYRQTDVAV